MSVPIAGSVRADRLWNWRERHSHSGTLLSQLGMICSILGHAAA